MGRIIAAYLMLAACANDRAAPESKPVPEKILAQPARRTRVLQVVAHRGVHQTFHKRDLTNDTCTAIRIDPPTHRFLENTIASIAEAFRLGASVVEIDVHRTSDGKVVVFHDWTLECRTNGEGVTREQTLSDLKQLDIGYGYTADGGKTFPFRGDGLGAMPTLSEILETFPNREFLIDQKDRSAETATLVANEVAALSAEQRQRISYWGALKNLELIQRKAPGVSMLLLNRQLAKNCLASFLTNSSDKACELAAIPVPLEIAIAGESLITRARARGNRVFVAGVDSPEALARLNLETIDGVVTDKIEVVGPLVQKAVDP